MAGVERRRRRHVPQRSPARDFGHAAVEEPGLGGRGGARVFFFWGGWTSGSPTGLQGRSELSPHTRRGFKPWRPSSEGPEAAEPLGGEGPE